MRYHYLALVAQGGATCDEFETFVNNHLRSFDYEPEYFHCSTLEDSTPFKELYPEEAEAYSPGTPVAELLFAHDGVSFEYVDRILNRFRSNSGRIRQRYLRKFTPRQAAKKGLTALGTEEEGA